MSQDPGLGDFRVLAWRPRQANDAFQALKRHFDAPAGTVEFTGFAAGEGYCVKGSNKNDPRGFGRLRRLAECNKPKGQRWSFFARDPDGPVENSGVFRSESGQNIERLAVSVEPARSLPARADDDIGALLQNMRQRIGMHEPSVGDEDIPFGNRRPIEPLATFLLGQLDKTEALGREIEGAMKAPQAVVFPNFLPGLWNWRPIEKPNAPPACRGHGPASEQLAYEVFHPDAAVAQALQQSNVGKVREACGRSRRACRSQPHAAKAISQDQPQKIGRGLHSARPQKGTRFAGGSFDSCGPAELLQRCLPEFVQERSVSYAMLESDSILAFKPYVSAYAVPPGRDNPGIGGRAAISTVDLIETGLS